jgi:hypothetical protein
LGQKFKIREQKPAGHIKRFEGELPPRPDSVETGAVEDEGAGAFLGLGVWVVGQRPWVTRAFACLKYFKIAMHFAHDLI